MVCALVVYMVVVSVLLISAKELVSVEREENICNRLSSFILAIIIYVSGLLWARGQSNICYTARAVIIFIMWAAALNDMINLVQS